MDGTTRMRAARTLIVDSKLVELCKNIARAVCARRRIADDTEDLMQDLLVSAWLTYDEARGPLASFLWFRARGLAGDRARKRTAAHHPHPSLDAPDPDETLAKEVDEAVLRHANPSDDATLVLALDACTIKRLLERLPAHEEKALLADSGERVQMAKARGVAPSTITRDARRAERRLRRALKERQSRRVSTLP